MFESFKQLLIIAIIMGLVLPPPVAMALAHGEPSTERQRPAQPSNLFRVLGQWVQIYGTRTAQYRLNAPVLQDLVPFYNWIEFESDPGHRQIVIKAFNREGDKKRHVASHFIPDMDVVAVAQDKEIAAFVTADRKVLAMDAGDAFRGAFRSPLPVFAMRTVDGDADGCEFMQRDSQPLSPPSGSTDIESYPFNAGDLLVFKGRNLLANVSRKEIYQKMTIGSLVFAESAALITINPQQQAAILSEVKQQTEELQKEYEIQARALDGTQKSQVLESISSRVDFKRLEERRNEFSELEDTPRDRLTFSEWQQYHARPHDLAQPPREKMYSKVLQMVSGRARVALAAAAAYMLPPMLFPSRFAKGTVLSRFWPDVLLAPGYRGPMVASAFAVFTALPAALGLFGMVDRHLRGKDPATHDEQVSSLQKVMKFTAKNFGYLVNPLRGIDRLAKPNPQTQDFSEHRRQATLILARHLALIAVARESHIDLATLVMARKYDLEGAQKMLQAVATDRSKAEEWERLAYRLNLDLVDLQARDRNFDIYSPEAAGEFAKRLKQGRETAERLKQGPDHLTALQSLRMYFDQAALRVAMFMHSEDTLKTLQGVQPTKEDADQFSREAILDHAMVTLFTPLFGARADLNSPEKLAASRSFPFVNAAHGMDIALNLYAHFFKSSASIMLNHGSTKPQREDKYQPYEYKQYAPGESKPETNLRFLETSGTTLKRMFITRDLNESLGDQFHNNLKTEKATFVATLISNMFIKGILGRMGFKAAIRSMIYTQAFALPSMTAWWLLLRTFSSGYNETLADQNLEVKEAVRKLGQAMRASDSDGKTGGVARRLEEAQKVWKKYGAQRIPSDAHEFLNQASDQWPVPTSGNELLLSLVNFLVGPVWTTYFGTKVLARSYNPTFGLFFWGGAGVSAALYTAAISYLKARPTPKPLWLKKPQYEQQLE